MAIIPIGAPRVSLSLRTQTLLTQLRANQGVIFRQQQRIATGENLLSAAEDPVAAGRIIKFTQRVNRQEGIIDSLRHADRWLSAAESSITEVSDLLIQAKTIALEQVSNLQSAEQRASAAVIIDSTLDRLSAIGNQQFEGRYLFGGQRSTSPAFDTVLGRLTYRGAVENRRAEIGDGLERAFDVTAEQLFGLGGSIISGFADLNPALTSGTRLSDLSGAAGLGIRRGLIQAEQIGGAGAGSFSLDTSGIDTAGEFVSRFNAAAANAGVGLSVAISGSGFVVSAGAGGQLRLSESGDSHAAADLGILTTTPLAGPHNGLDVQPRLTPLTPLAALNGGTGLTLPSGVRITNADQSVSVSFAGAANIQDVLNRLNNSGIGIRASLNPAATGIDVLNLVAGTDLTISENGGGDATALGIRTLHSGTRLDALNRGRGVRTVDGADLRIVDANGTAFDVDIDPSQTIADVIGRINAAAALAGSTLTAGLRVTGNGILLSQPSGAGTIQVQQLGGSAAAADLGLLKNGSSLTLEGDDNYPTRQGGVISALYRLADALRDDDTAEITAAGEEVEQSIRLINDQRGRLGARSRAVQDGLNAAEDAIVSTRLHLSEVKEADLTEAITRFQQAQIALQANLQTGSALLNLSLLDFLS